MVLAKDVVGKTYKTCGTPDYFAPEIIASKGHTHAVDWWTLGILSFELMIGHPPFESATPMQIYQKVSRGINKVALSSIWDFQCPQTNVKHVFRSPRPLRTSLETKQTMDCVKQNRPTQLH